MNWKQKTLAAAVFAALSIPAYGQTGGAGPAAKTQESSTTDTEARGTNREEMLLGFLHRANHREIELANLAKDNSSSRQVKDFADRVIKDHQSADEQVLTFAKNHNIDLGAMHSRVSAKEELTENERRSRAVGSATGEYAFMAETGAGEEASRAMTEYKATLEKLRTLKGADFDREFARAMVKDHQMVIDRVTRARSRINDPELTGLVDKLLPTLKQHLSMAQKLQDNLSKS